MVISLSDINFKANSELIRKDLALDSHKGVSFSPERRAEQEIQAFVADVQGIYAKLKPYAKSEEQKTFLLSEMERFQSGYAAKYNEYLSSHGRVVSSFIAGPSNFPARQMNKRQSALENKLSEMNEYSDKAHAAILRELKKMAVSEAGGEVEVLKQKIADAEKNQEDMKAANVILRSKASDGDKVKQLLSLGFSDEQAHKLLKPDFAGRVGYSFRLQNNLANIKRMKDRVLELEKKEATPSADIAFEGGTMHDSKEDDRIQLFFDQKPAQAMIDKLKGEGWRWSQSIGAWSRKRTDNALFSARRILGLEQQNPVFVPVKETVEITKTKYVSTDPDKLVSIVERSNVQEEESDKPEPEQRDSTIVKKQVEALNVKVLRAKIDSYNPGLIRLTVPTNTPPIAGEVRRELARGFNGLQIPTKTWVWFQRPKTELVQEIAPMSKEIKIIENLGYVLKESNKGQNEFRSWTIFIFTHPDGKALLYNDSDEVLIVRDRNRKIILEGRFKLNVERLQMLHGDKFAEIQEQMQRDKDKIQKEHEKLPDAEFEKAKLFLSALATARTLDELVGWQPAVKRWSIKFPELEKELESEYQARLDYLKAVKETTEAERKEKASKPQSAQAKDLYKQMRTTNSVRELDDWRNRVLFEAHLPDVEEDILLRDLAAKWRVYLETRGIPALEKLDKLPLDYKDEDYYFGTEVYVHPTTTIFGDLPWKGIIHEARNGGELWEVVRAGSESEGTSRIPIERLYVTKLVEKPEPRYQPPPDTSSADYKAGYNLGIQGRIAPAVPAWTDQGKVDFAQGYKDGTDKREKEKLLEKIEPTKSDEERFKELKDGFTSYQFGIDSPEMKELVALERKLKKEEKPKFVVENPFGVDLSRSVVPYQEIPATESGKKLLQNPTPLTNEFIEWFRKSKGENFVGAKLSTFTDGEPYFFLPGIEGAQVTLRDYLKLKESKPASKKTELFAPTQKKLFQGETKEEQTSQMQFNAPVAEGKPKPLISREEKYRKERAKEAPERREYGLEAFGVQKSGIKGLSEFEERTDYEKLKPQITKKYGVGGLEQLHRQIKQGLYKLSESEKWELVELIETTVEELSPKLKTELEQWIQQHKTLQEKVDEMNAQFARTDMVSVGYKAAMDEKDVLYKKIQNYYKNQILTMPESKFMSEESITLMAGEASLTALSYSPKAVTLQGMSKRFMQEKPTVPEKPKEEKQVKVAHAKKLISEAFAKDIEAKDVAYLQKLFVKLKDEETKALSEGVYTKGKPFTEQGHVIHNLKDAINHIIEIKKTKERVEGGKTIHELERYQKPERRSPILTSREQILKGLKVPYKPLRQTTPRLYAMSEEQSDIEEEREAMELARQTVSRITEQKLKIHIEREKRAE